MPMNHDELLKYISLFREKAEQGKLVIFVGAGVSQNVDGMPSWNALIQNMAKSIGYSRCDYCRHKTETCKDTCLLKTDFSTDELLKIPQHVFNKDNELYIRVLAESVPGIMADAPLSSAIFDINPVHIITTNYDKLLEASTHIFREQYQVIVHDKDLLNANKGKYIIKMHGDLSEPNSIVLKEQDYLNYSQNHVLIELFIKSLLTDHIVLFLGYALNDYNIKLILSWLNYMRSQNRVLDEGRRVGYLIQDQETVDDTQLAYFNSNNIEVINLNSMPLIKGIPTDLSNEIGKRLYSFLRIIADPALEENLASIGNAVKFMSQFSFISYEQIMKFLYVKTYVVTDRQLRLFSESDYIRLTAFMDSENEESNNLKQLFLNAGIVLIECLTDLKTMRYYTGKFSQNALLQDRLFNLYILNQYDEIKALLSCDFESFDSNERWFYQSIINGYHEILADWREVDASELSVEQKVTYLHNSAVIKMLEGGSFHFDSVKVKQFVHNLSSSREREIFAGYLDLYSSNSEKRLTMHEALEKLKKDIGDRNTVHFGGTSCVKLYEIKRFAMTQYFFYHNNHILYQGFSDLKDFFKPYIEAIMCANSDAAERSTHFGNMEFANEKYPVEYIDLDIITKFISTKDLYTLIKKYNVNRLNTDAKEVIFLTDCFQNLCHSVAGAKTYGLWQSSFSALSNIILLLNLVDLDEDGKKKIASSVEELLSDEVIVPIFFSAGWPDFRQSLRELAKLCSVLSFSENFEIVRQIVDSKGFFEYAVNVHFNSLRHLVECFLSKGEETINRIRTIIDATENFHEKVILLRLFYQQISDNTIQQKYTDFLSANFARLPTAAIYDFVFSGWLSPEQNSIQAFLNEILEISRKKVTGMRSYPDPLETKLECVYLLYISDMIADISVLNELSDERSHLQFLLDPERFDYSQVDFSNYMWENFARREKYMNCFIAHKDTIIPKIQNRIKAEEASEAEKRILYGFLLSGDEVWKM